MRSIIYYSLDKGSVITIKIRHASDSAMYNESHIALQDAQGRIYSEHGEQC